jgi:hypothetical protein
MYIHAEDPINRTALSICGVVRSGGSRLGQKEAGMPRGVQNYKIRRLRRIEGTRREVFEWYHKQGLDWKWESDSIDAYLFTDYKGAIRICEQIKVNNRDPQVIYHSVVPVG